MIFHSSLVSDSYFYLFFQFPNPCQWTDSRNWVIYSWIRNHKNYSKWLVHFMQFFLIAVTNTWLVGQLIVSLKFHRKWTLIYVCIFLDIKQADVASDVNILYKAMTSDVELFTSQWNFACWLVICNVREGC